MQILRIAQFRRGAAHLLRLTLFAAAAPGAVLFAAEPVLRRPVSELVASATIPLGKTADWVAITTDAVWVGTTGPDAVQRIDPATNVRTATVPLPGNPCAGLAVGFGSLWVPLCGHPNALARVDLATHAVTLLPRIGPAAREGGISVSGDSVWLIVDAKATLVRIDPATNRVRQRIRVPHGSQNALYADGYLWVTRADRSGVSVIDALTGSLVARVPTGPRPRFLSAGAGSV